MNRFRNFLLIALICASTQLSYAGDYLTNFETAKKKATTENKNLLVKFTGSDWCPPCIKLEKEVFAKKEFIEKLSKDFVIVVLDFPQKSKLPEELSAMNKKIAADYHVRNYPTVILMNAQGKAFKSLIGYDGTSMEDYLASILSSLKAKDFR